MSRASGLLAFVLIAISAPVLGQELVEFRFEGRVEPLQRVQVANQVSGVVSGVHFEPGQRLERGDLMYSIESTSFKIDVDAAKAAVAEAHARLALAEDVANRQTELVRRGTGAMAIATQSALEAKIAKAAVARAEAALASAQLALARTQVTAPISGTAQRAKIAPGAFVETEGGTVLGEIVQMDPVLVAYRVSYADRQEALTAAGTTSARKLLKKIKLSLLLPSGEVYPHAGEPQFESAALDRSGMLTTWGEFPNPTGMLIPGLNVTIISRVSTTPTHGSSE